MKERWFDSQNIEHTEPNHLNYYWDFEPIEMTTDEHWQDLRERAAIAALSDALSDPNTVGNFEQFAEAAVGYADALVERLKKK